MQKLVAPLSLLALIAALAVVGTAGASRQVGISPVKGSFKYCDNPTFPPMESKTSAGKLVGFDIDMANAIAKLWKVKAKFVFSSFGGLLPALEAKRCDVVISGIFITPDRVKKDPAVSYMRTHRALVVKAGNPKSIKSPDDLSGKNVAVQANTKYEEYLKTLNDQFKSSGKAQMNLQSYPGDEDAVAQILLGRADAVLTQDTAAGTYRVRFFKAVTCHGRTVNVCQRSIDIRSAPSPDQAVEAAKQSFARLENVAEWFLHADYVEVDALPTIAFDELNAKDIGGRHRRGAVRR